MTTKPISTEPFSEEIARAELYGLLARLWLAPPDAALPLLCAVAELETVPLASEPLNSYDSPVPSNGASSG